MSIENENIVVGRILPTSINDFVHRCEVHIEELSRPSIGGDSAMVAILCDAVRLAREYGDRMQERLASLADPLPVPAPAEVARVTFRGVVSRVGKGEIEVKWTEGEMECSAWLPGWPGATIGDAVAVTVRKG